MRRVVTIVAVVALAAALAPVGNAGAGGFCTGFSGERWTDRPGDRVVMKDNCFTPTILRVEPGSTVDFVNGDGTPHTVGGAVGSFGDIHKEIAPGVTVSYEFRDEGVFPYACYYHPGMIGAVVVGDGEGKGVPQASVVPMADDAAGSGKAEGSASEANRNETPTSSPSSAFALPLAIAVVLLMAALVALTARHRKTAVRTP